MDGHLVPYCFLEFSFESVMEWDGKKENDFVKVREMAQQFRVLAALPSTQVYFSVSMLADLQGIVTPSSGDPKLFSTLHGYLHTDAHTHTQTGTHTQHTCIHTYTHKLTHTCVCAHTHTVKNKSYKNVHWWDAEFRL